MTMRTKSGGGEDWKEALVQLIMLHGLSRLKQAIFAFAWRSGDAAPTKVNTLAEVWRQIRTYLPPTAIALRDLLEAKGLTPIGNERLREFDLLVCTGVLYEELRRIMRGRERQPIVLYGPFAGLIQTQTSRRLGTVSLLAGQSGAAAVARLLLEHMLASGPVPDPTVPDIWPEYPPLSLRAVEICCQASSSLPGRGRKRAPSQIALYTYPDIVTRLLERGNSGQGAWRRVKAPEWSAAKRVLLLGGTRRRGGKGLPDREEPGWLMEATKAQGRHLQVPSGSADLSPNLHRVADLIHRSEVAHSLMAIPGLLTRIQGFRQDFGLAQWMQSLMHARGAYLVDPFSPAAATCLLDLLETRPGRGSPQLYEAMLQETIEQFNLGLMVLTRRASAGSLLFNHWLPYLSRNRAMKLRLPEELDAEDLADLAQEYWNKSGQRTLLNAIEEHCHATFSDVRHVEVFKEYMGSLERELEERERGRARRRPRAPKPELE